MMDMEQEIERRKDRLRKAIEWAALLPVDPGEVIIPPKAYTPAAALAHQEGGQHYKDMKIQPFEYNHQNGIPFAEGCVIKYVSRWRTKGGIEDLKKARHFLDLLIEAEGEA